MQAKRNDFEVSYTSQIARITVDTEETKKRIKETLTSASQHQSQRVELAKQLGGVQARINMIAEQGNDFEEFLESFARTALNNAQTELGSLQRQFAETEQEDRTRAEHNVSRHTEIVQRTQRAIENFDRALSSFLSERFGNQELSDLARLFNIDILEQPLEPKSVSLRDADAFASNLKQVAQRIHHGIYQDETAEIHLPQSQRPANEIGNVKALQDRLCDHEAELNRWRRIVDSIKDREVIAARIQSLLEEVEGKRDEHGNNITEGLRRRLFRFEAFQKSSGEEPNLRAQFKTISENIAAEDRNITALSERGLELQEKRSVLLTKNAK